MIKLFFLNINTFKSITIIYRNQSRIYHKIENKLSRQSELIRLKMIKSEYRIIIKIFFKFSELFTVIINSFSLLFSFLFLEKVN